MKKILTRGNDKLLAVFSVLTFVISMIPIWYLAKYARPSGDDYGYSVLTHAAWLDTHSLIEVFKAATETVKNNYFGWNGDWFTTFLFSLMPEVFVPYSFWIVPYIMTGAVIIATLVFVYEIWVNIVKGALEGCLIFTSLILFASYQYIPSTAIGMYWYVGATHYMLPYALGLLGIVFIFRFIRTGRFRCLFGVSLCSFMVGGSSYFTSLLLFMVFFAVGVLAWRKEPKRVTLLMVPFTICAIGFVIQCKAPGNTVRGGENFGFDFGVALYTILESLKRSVFMIGRYILEKPIIFVILVIIVVIGWEMMSNIVRDNKFTYPYPLLYIIIMYGVYSAMFAPEVYSEVYDSIDISLGPATIQYFTFLMVSFLSILYCEGWIIKIVLRKSGAYKFEYFMENSYRMWIMIPVFFLCVIVLVFNRGWLKESVDVRVYEYVSSGQAEDFKEQIASQMKILLDTSVEDAYLVPINSEQGPLMHMPVTSDENAFTNMVVKNFYRKNKVVMVNNE
ncbi:hypothetical protein SAMN05216405_3997 [Lachnospiraceae bacterium NLAE-zl-G231]|nr:hypothetical protein SAMN05216405_3997 [Lachnospiraceae bacterium NLAE-zl-G231]